MVGHGRAMRRADNRCIVNINLGVYIMTDQEIIALFDSTNITLAELAIQSGRSVAALKQLLLGR